MSAVIVIGAPLVRDFDGRAEPVPGLLEVRCSVCGALADVANDPWHVDPDPTCGGLFVVDDPRPRFEALAREHADLEHDDAIEAEGWTP